MAPGTRMGKREGTIRGFEGDAALAGFGWRGGDADGTLADTGSLCGSVLPAVLPTVF